MHSTQIETMLLNVAKCGMRSGSSITVFPPLLGTVLLIFGSVAAAEKPFVSYSVVKIISVVFFSFIVVSSCGFIFTY